MNQLLKEGAKMNASTQTKHAIETCGGVRASVCVA